MRENLTFHRVIHLFTPSYYGDYYLLSIIVIF